MKEFESAVRGYKREIANQAAAGGTLSARPAGPVEASMDSMRQASNMLLSRLSMLEERLKSVMVPQTPSPEGSPAIGALRVCSPMVDGLSAIENNVRHASDIIDDMLARLET